MKRIQQGFTLIELMIVVAIICILTALMAGAVDTARNGQKNDGSMCIGGYKFTHNGQQIFNQNGGGIPCDQRPQQSGEAR